MPLSYDLTTFQILGQKFVKFFVGILVQTMTSKRHFEINWPVDEDTEALPVTAADVDGFMTKSLDEVDIFS